MKLTSYNQQHQNAGGSGETAGKNNGEIVMNEANWKSQWFTSFIANGGGFQHISRILAIANDYRKHGFGAETTGEICATFAKLSMVIK